MSSGHIYTFAEIDGTRLAATADRDGANLPGGPSGWRRLAKMDTDAMDTTSGIVGLGNAAEILTDIRERGLFLTAAKDADWVTPAFGEAN
ncbi:hypothetical protein MKK68_25125 [Methylobacterium sp. E-016]|uniref:hypothetical protein n=1 Tax=Methylobacterium sp. E-016 TaxID=2836556 RepID=UPI001FBBB92A|nr:hypothetical protein [Methylobacterium sp. E-016]MCJ2078879.1 hypothetical protein [Methylobacterium sp. E-016]